MSCLAISTLVNPLSSLTFCERTPAYRGGSFLLQREQRHWLRRATATYTLSTGVDSRATHGILWITSGRYSPGFFPNIYGSVLIAVMVDGIEPSEKPAIHLTA